MAGRPNVLLLTVDSLRADAVSDDRIDTPAWDRLAKEGTTYERAFSQGPFTTFSMPSLFTSRYPSGLEYVEFSDSTVGVYVDDEPTIQTALDEEGYATAGFHSNPLLSNLFGFDRGFDVFDARLPFSNTEFLPGRAKILADKLFRLVRKHAYLPAEKLNRRAVNWLDDRSGDDPFFLWLHYMDVHGPYQSKSGSTYLNKYRGERLWRTALNGSPTDEERETLRKWYREEVEYTDAQVADLLGSLSDRGLLEDTLVVLTADHGEGFGEHDHYSHPHRLYDELVHVPLVVRTPEKRGGSVDHLVELLDVFPTLCEAAGADVPDGIAGRTLPEPGSPVPGDAQIVSEADLTPAYNACLRTDRWKYVRDDPRERELLFDLESDPKERENVVEERSEVVEELSIRLDDHLSTGGRAVGPDRDVRRREIEDDDVTDRLEDLGYLE